MKRTTAQFSLRVAQGLLAILAILDPGTPVSAASRRLEGQRPSQPDVVAIPETGRRVRGALRPPSERWVKTVEDPVRVAVNFSALFTAVPYTGIEVELNGVEVSGSANDWGWGFTDLGEVRLQPNKTYTLHLTGSDVVSADVSLSAGSIYRSLQANGGDNNPARRYRVYFQSPGTGEWLKVCQGQYPSWADPYGQSSVMAASFKIQVRPDLGARPVVYPGLREAGGEDQADSGWLRDEPPMDVATVIGDGAEATLGFAGELDPTSVRVQWSVALGRLWSGTTAGRVRLDETRLGTNAYSPLGLNYEPHSLDTNEVQVIRALDDTNRIAQIRVPHGLMVAEVITNNAYRLRFFIPVNVGQRDTNGFFTLNPTNAETFVTWQIDSGSTNGSTNMWRLMEIRNGATNVTTVQRSVASTTNLWSLTRGAGSQTVMESRRVSVASGGGVTNRIEQVEVLDGQSNVCSRIVEVYQAYPWACELVAVTNDPGGANLITKLSYFENTNNTATYGKISQIEYPDGYWEKREYSENPYSNTQPYGSLVRTIRPWKNTTTSANPNDCLVVDYRYPTTGPGSFEMETWHDATAFGEELDGPKSRSLVTAQAVEITLDDCGDVEYVREGHNLGSDALNMQGEYVEIASYPPSAGRRAGQLRHKKANYGALDAYDYEWGQWTNGTFTVNAGGTDLRQTIYQGLNSNMGEGFGDTAGLGESGNEIEVIILVPGRSSKEVRIVQAGNLVARFTSVYQGGLTNFGLIEQVFYQRDCLGHATNVYRKDPLPTPSSGSQRTLYAADWTGGSTWPTDRKRSQTDETGTVTTHTFDALKRLVAQTKSGVTAGGYPPQGAVTNLLAYDSAGRVVTNTMAAGSLALTTVTRYDLAGRLRTQVDPAGLTNSLGYQLTQDGYLTFITNSAGWIQTNTAFFDRRPASLTGTSVTNLFFDYGQTGDDMAKISFRPHNITTVTLGTNTSQRIRKTMTDTRQVPIVEWLPGFRSTNGLATANWFVGGQHYATSRTAFENEYAEPEPAWCTWFYYDHFGQRIRAMQDGPDDEVYGDETFAGTDRITTSTNYFELDGQGRWFRVSEQVAYPWDNDATPSLLQRTKERLTGFVTNEISEVFQFDADTNQTTVKVTVDLANKKVTTVTTLPQSSLNATQVVVNGLLQTESTPTVSTPTWHYYDALGRETAVKDPLGNVNGTAFHATTGQIIATTNAHGLITTFEYYQPNQANPGLLRYQSGPTGKKTYYNYNGRGQLTQTWGNVPYPEQRDYNAFGDLISLTTYRGGTTWTGSTWPTNNTGPTADLTQWQYDEPTGLLTNKIDALSRSVAFDYYNNHLLKSRFWARSVSSTNIYSANGDLVRIDYSDGTPSVQFTNETVLTLNRQAKPSFIRDASGDWTLLYDHAGRVLSSGATAGLLSGVTKSNHFHQVKGRDWLSVTSAATPIRIDFGYDTYGRLGSVTNGAYSAAYAYRASSDLLQTTTCRSNSTTVLTTTRTWDTGPRLLAIHNAANGVPVTSHAYLYDSLNRRTQATLEDASRWQYAYNDRDELIGGRRFWPDWTPVAGQRFEYDYDNIGNREAARRGGDSSGGGLRSEDYTPNGLNQYTSRSQGNQVDVLGAAYAGASVTVNGNAPSRFGEYFAGLLTVANGSGPVMQLVTCVASLAGQNSTNTGRMLVPPATNSFAYDADGNLTNDATWVYRWDPENRLIQMSNVVAGSLAATNRLKLDFAYDYLGRRVQKIVSTNNSTNWVPVSTNRFLYDGWNLLAVVGPNQTPTMSFVWGQDLSGTLEQAGGIGGLVAVVERSGGQVSDAHFAGYDGNGNLTALIKASDRTTSARYEYSPFGELLRASGALAKANPFRWSTKFVDEETGLAYYGFRYYSAVIGRWLSRDPIEEGGGLALYAFVANSPLRMFDGFGTAVNLIDTETAAGEGVGLNAQTAAGIYRAQSKLRNTLDMVQDMSDIWDAIMAMEDPTAALDVMSDIVADVFDAKRNVALEGHGSDPLHHLQPQKWRNKLGPQIHQFTVHLAKRLHQRLHSGKGFGRGGIWNGLWRHFMGKHDLNPDEKEIQQFLKQMTRLFGLDDLDQIPYRR